MAQILLIDDDRLLLAVGRDALTLAGHDVVTARDGEEGLRLFKAAAYDLVITDVCMPEMDGFETIRGLLEYRPGTLIITQSAGTTALGPHTLTVAARLGSRACLEKPYAPAQLVAMVAAVLVEAAPD